MKKFDLAGSIILLALEVLHTILTPVLAKAVNSPPLEFVAIGLLFIIIGLINIARINTDIPLIYTVCIISNALGFSWICLGFILNIMNNESFSQGILPAIALIIVLYQSVLGRWKMGSEAI